MSNTSIYEKVLGKKFQTLHPMLQKRYRLSTGEVFHAKGRMKEIKGGPRWLYPIWLLGSLVKLVFPEQGKDIPFTLKNYAYQSQDGTEKVHWERAFYFPKKTRYFNDVMSFDAKRQIIKDYLGEPSPLYSDLQLIVHSDGSLQIDSIKQRLVIGKMEIPLPRILYGIATVRERYDDDKACYHIEVTVRNPIIGIVFAYVGEFHA